MTNRLLRAADIIGRAATKTRPAKPGLIPRSASAFYADIRAGRFPRPHHLGSRTAVWRESDVLAWINTHAPATIAA
jgi:hypothetical protein